MMAPKLEVMICTCGDHGLDKVAAMTLPSVDGVGYLVSCQSAPRELPAALQRDDLRVVFTDSNGLSNNRNNALEHVSAPYAIVADDDLNYYADGLRQLLATFDSHPEADFITFKIQTPYHRTYPEDICDIVSRRVKNYNVMSVEIAFRTACIRQHGLSFSPLLGIGAQYATAAEENVFLYNARRHGCRMWFYPILVGEHPQYTTLYNAVRTPAGVRADGVAICLMYPLTMPLRLLLKAKRLRGGFFRNLYYLLQGVAFAITHRRQLVH